MAKPYYAIRRGLNSSFLDHEIKVVSRAPAQSLKQLLFLFAGFAVGAWVVMSTFVASASMGWKFVFLVWWIAVVFYFGNVTKTKELMITRIPVLLSYLPKAARYVFTRRSSDPSDFASIVGIHRIDEDGRLHFNDGSQGQIYLVVGSASYLLFDEDRVSILDRVDAFWRKIDTNCEWTWVTTKEPQRIYYQAAAFEQRNQELINRDPDLLALQNEQYSILTEHVGGKFTSIHQYLVLKAKSEDSLRRAHSMVLQPEVEESGLMIKEATMLDRDEAITMLRTFYTGVDASTLQLRASEGSMS